MEDSGKVLSLEKYSLKISTSGGLKKIFLICEQKEVKEITGFDKVDNPVLAIHRGSLFIVWEHYGRTSQLAYTRIAPEGIDSVDSKDDKNILWLSHIEANPPCYRPRLSSHGEDLLLVYEQFVNQEYRIAGRFWQGDKFSVPFLLSGNRGNSQEPWIEPLAEQDGFLLSYENSQPLYKDYEWISPAGNKVIIPGFGHGWRVETKSYLKKISIADSKLFAAVLEGDGQILEKEEESSGCPRVISLGTPQKSTVSGPLLAVVFCAMGDHIWKILYAFYDGHGWSESFDTGLVDERRITPQISYDRNKAILNISAAYPPVDKPQSVEISLVPFYKDNNGDSPRSDHSVRTFTSPAVCAELQTETGYGDTKTIDYGNEILELFWGDLHMHSNISKCSLHSKFHCVEPEEKFRQSRDVGGLDFAMLTDHDTMTDEEWERIKEQADFHNRPGVFTAFHGFEWTATQGPEPKQGHYNILYRDRGRLYRVREEDGSHITRLWEDMVPGDVLTIPHHPADETHTLDWQFFDSRFEPLVEIFQVRGSYEYPGNSLDPSLFRPEKMVPGASLLDALERGYEFGFTSGGEHEGVGITAVFARENTREALFHALKNRQVYGTTGDRIFMDFRVNGVLMGGEINRLEGNPVISAVIEGTAPIRELRLMRDGRKIFSGSYKKNKVRFSWTDHDFSKIMEERETHYYYLVVEQENGEAGWASPVFIKKSKLEE